MALASKGFKAPRHLLSPADHSTRVTIDETYPRLQKASNHTAKTSPLFPKIKGKGLGRYAPSKKGETELW